MPEEKPDDIKILTRGRKQTVVRGAKSGWVEWGKKGIQSVTVTPKKGEKVEVSSR